jgi:hypothetical protein
MLQVIGHADHVWRTIALAITDAPHSKLLRISKRYAISKLFTELTLQKSKTVYPMTD